MALTRDEFVKLKTAIELMRTPYTQVDGDKKWPTVFKCDVIAMLELYVEPNEPKPGPGAQPHGGRK